jgi:hypothetical protein
MESRRAAAAATLHRSRPAGINLISTRPSWAGAIMRAASSISIMPCMVPWQETPSKKMIGAAALSVYARPLLRVGGAEFSGSSDNGNPPVVRVKHWQPRIKSGLVESLCCLSATQTFGPLLGADRKSRPANLESCRQGYRAIYARQWRPGRHGCCTGMTVSLHFCDMPQAPAASSVSWSSPAKAQGQCRV